MAVIQRATSSRTIAIRRARGISIARRQAAVSESRGRETLRSKAARLGLKTEDIGAIASEIQRRVEAGEAVPEAELQFLEEIPATPSERANIQRATQDIRLFQAKQAEQKRITGILEQKRQQQVQAAQERVRAAKQRELAYERLARKDNAARSAQEFKQGFNVSLKSGEIGRVERIGGRDVTIYKSADPASASTSGARFTPEYLQLREEYRQEANRPFNVSLRSGAVAQVTTRGQVTAQMADVDIGSPSPITPSESLAAQQDLKIRRRIEQLRESGTRRIKTTDQTNLPNSIVSFNRLVGTSEIAEAKGLETARKIEPVAKGITEFSYDISVRPVKGLYKGLTTPFINLATTGKFEAPLRGDPDFEAFVTATTFSLPAAGGLKVVKAFGLGIAGLTGYKTTKSLAKGDLKETTKGVLGTALALTPVLAKSKTQLGEQLQREQLALLKEQGYLKKPETIRGLEEAIKLQKFVRKAPDVPVGSIKKIIPEGLTKGEERVVKDVLIKDTNRVFGGSTLKIRDIRETKDIDLAAKSTILESLKIVKPRSSRQLTQTTGAELKEVSPTPEQIVIGRESIGIRGEKGLDIKELGRVKGFLFAQKPVKSLEGVGVTRLSEQYSRSLSGTLELRKGGKDVRDVVLTARSLIGTARERARETRLPFFAEYRLLKVLRAEKRLALIEKVPEEIIPIIVRSGGEAPTIPKDISNKINFRDFFPTGKRGQKDISSPLINNKKFKEIYNYKNIKKFQESLFKDTRRKTLQPSSLRSSELKESRISSSQLTQFSLGRLGKSLIKESVIRSNKLSQPSAFIPSQIKQITPSKINPYGFDIPKITITPSSIPPSRIPSQIPPPLTPSTITPSPSYPNPLLPYKPPPEIFLPPELEGKQKKKKRKTKYKSQLFPSLTAVLFDIRKSPLASRAVKVTGGSLGFEVRPLSFTGNKAFARLPTRRTFSRPANIKRLINPPRKKQ